MQNSSNQFEARQVLVKIPKSNSILFKDMYKSILPIIVSHGEGKISIKNRNMIKKATMQYVDMKESIRMNILIIQTDH